MAEWLKETSDRFNQAVLNSGQPLSCTLGCSACCSERLQVSRQEADHIWKFMTHDERKAAIPKIKAWLEKYNASNFGEAGEIDALEYRRAMIACPLLKENRCSVYEARPLSCRCHGAIGPRIACEDLNLRPRQVFAMAPELIGHQVQQMVRRLDLSSMEIADLGIFLAVRAGLVDDAEIERSEFLQE